MKAVFTAARVSLVDDQPLVSLQEMGIEPGPSNRYAYVLRMPEDIIPVGATSPRSTRQGSRRPWTRRA
ncbi:hypothetical protein [Corallococcus sp. M7]